MGGSYTEGNWEKIGNTLVLTSYDKYKEQKEAVMEVIEVKEDQNDQADLSEESVDPDSINSDSVKIDFDIEFLNSRLLNSRYESVSFPAYTDSTKFYFDHVMYRLVGDTLYELDKTTQLGRQSRFWRPREYLPLKTYNEYLYPQYQ
jgi:hypothetical protein